jgi:tetratricopeptide (TPR) repeat protein
MNRILIGIVRVCGFGCLLLSAKKTWFALPVLTAGMSTTPTITAGEPWSTNWYQMVAVLVALASVGCWVFYSSRARLLVSLLVVWLIVLLAFPWTVMIADCQTAARATWLQMQHENLTWLGGDLATSQASAAAGWKTRLYVVDTPRRLSMMNPPAWQPWDFALNRMPELFEWLGYTNTFCQFVRRGWFLAIAGTCLLLAATCLVHGTLDTKLARQALLILFFGCLVVCLAAWTPPFVAGRSLGEARRHTVRGHYEDALNSLRAATKRLPVLAEDTYYIAQVGLLEHHLRRHTPAAKLYHANLLEREGRFAEAERHCEQLLSSRQASAAVRREASRGLLRSAVHALNAGNDDLANRNLQFVLAAEPCNLKANYMLQLAALRSGQFERIRDLVEHLAHVYDYFCFPNKKAVLAAGQQNLFYAAYLEGELEVARSHNIRMKRP